MPESSLPWPTTPEVAPPAALDQEVLTVEFKINFLRPAGGDRLRCWGHVLRAGKTLAVAESEIFAAASSDEKLVAKATITLALVPEQ